ncbi:hypothetical protein ACF09H_25690 [Streptomyces sp. NPDC014983]|uniref:hypothetical protein n=1 Tax=Streptomyces sp. NPDC014983 TaxID=3364933 RepID=UPI0036F58CC4
MVAYRRTDSTALGSADQGAVAHCRVRPWATSHSAELSGTARIRGASAGSPARTVSVMAVLSPTRRPVVVSGIVRT